MMTVGGGSSSLKARYEISPLDGLKARVGDAAEVMYARGYVGNIDGSYNGVVSKVNLAESRSADELLDEAVNKAKSADYVVFVGGLNKNSRQVEIAHRMGFLMVKTELSRLCLRPIPAR